MPPTIPIEVDEVRVTLDFVDAPLSDITLWVSELTGANFMLTEDLSERRITVISGTPVSIREAVELYLAALYMHGLTVVPHGGFARIVPADGASHEPLPMILPER